MELVVDSGVKKMEGEAMRKNQTLICAPIMADSVDQMLILMQKAKISGADLVEVRVDSLKSFNPRPDIDTLIKQCPLPTLFTYSCTIPHKEAALDCCAEIDPTAKAIGAVNCIIRRPDGKLFGCNTDYIGAISAIEEGLQGSQPSISGSPLAGKLFVVIGAGGAGKAIAYGAKEKGARVVIANRTYERARELAIVVGAEALSLDELSNFHPENDMILANTTSIGMQPKVDDTPISKEALKHYSLVFDAVYTPKITRLLREAQESGAKIVTGVEMFIGQAYEQYERFTGLPAPKELFKNIMSTY